MISDTPAVLLRPRHVSSVALPRLLPLVTFLALFSSLVLTLLLTVALGRDHMPFDELAGAPGWAVFVALVGVSLVGGLALGTVALRAAYARSETRLGDRAIEFRRDWVFSSRKTVPYERVVEVSWSAGPLQRRAGIGTLRLSTAGEARTGSGLDIVDVPEPENAYREVLKRVEAARKRA